jgi:hypothetical protein
LSPELARAGSGKLNLTTAIIVILSAVALIGPSHLIMFLSVVALLIGRIVLWRANETPVLLFMFFYQWLQVTMPVIYSNLSGEELSNYSPYGGNIELATLLSLFALTIFALGMKVGVGKPHFEESIAAHAQAETIDTSRIFLAYIGMAVISILLVKLAESLPAISQLLLASAPLKWAIYFAAAYVSLVRGRRMGLLLFLPMLIELAASLGSFYSDFKTAIFVTLHAMIAAGVRFSGSGILAIGLTTGLLLNLSIYWTAVKADFRSYINDSATNNVSIGTTEKLTKLIELVSEVTYPNFSEASERMIRRIGYTDFFGAVLNEVPERVPYENGAIVLDALVRPFMPRVLFPEKTEIDDSERTAKYAGVLISGKNEGTSISIGWLGELYIDFGTILMMPAIFLFGSLYGIVYRHLVGSQLTIGLPGMGFATGIFIPLAAMESSVTKLFGFFIAAILVCILFSKTLLPRIMKWLLVRKNV